MDGSVIVNTGGTVSPGTTTATGKLTIAGGYTQSAGSTLVIKLGGNVTPGTDYDAIAAGGSASLAGTIQTTAINGFVPSGGDSYHVLTFASSSGDFAVQSGFAFGNVFLVEQASAGGLDLRAVANPIVVTNGNDAHVAGQISLREAIAFANAGSRLGVAPTIDFAAGLSFSTIQLTQGPLELGEGGAGSGAMTIDATGQAITIKGDGASQVLLVDGGVSASLIGLTIANGVGQFGGGILNHGTLTLTADSFNDNVATSAGAGLWSDGALTITGSIFRANRVASGTGDGGAGIAIAAGSASISSSDFFDNSIVAPAVGAANSAGGAIVSLISTTLHFNRFNGNTNSTPTHGNAIAVIAPATLNADDNWWSSNSGPAANDVVGGSAGAFAPQPVNAWLQLAIAANPTAIFPSQSSTVTTGFTTDSAGNSIAPANLAALFGSSVDFGGNTAPGSSLTNGQTNIQATGLASVTYNAGPNGGLDSVSATVDGVTVSAGITIKQAPQITSTLAATFTVGVNNNFNVTTIGFPAPALSEVGDPLPTGVTFRDNHDGTATFSGMPAPTTGVYHFNLTAANGVGTNAFQTLTLTVVAPPIITPISNVTLGIGQAANISISARAGVPTAITLTQSGKLPAGLTFTPGKPGTAAISGKPMAGTGGAYPVTITSGNGVFQSKQSFTVFVQQPPAITTAKAATLVAGQGGTFLVKTTGFPFPTFSLSGATIPAGVSLVDNHNGTATLTAPNALVTPTTYPLTITASNGVGTAAIQTFTLTVVTPPSITINGTPTWTVGQTQATSLNISSTPGVPAGTVTIKETGKLPTGIMLTPGAHGTATLGGKPAAGTGGSYPITLTASTSTASVSQAITLVVNQAPAITTARATTLVAGQNGTFLVKATGFPFAGFSLSGATIPAGVTLVDNHNGTATLTAPNALVTPKNYVMTIGATNGIGVSAAQTFTLTVLTPPSFTISGSPTFSAGQTQGTYLNLSSSPGVPAGTISFKETGKLPMGITLTPGPHGTATLGGKPPRGTGGSYGITLTAAGSAAGTSQALTLLVNEAPAFTTVKAVTFTVGQAGTFLFKTSGYPAAAITLAPSDVLPAGLSLHSNGDGTATLSGIPAAGDATGPLTLHLTAANGIGTAATQMFTLTLVQPPIITSAASKTFSNGVQSTFTITTIGSPTVKLTVTGTPPKGITFTDNKNGTGTLHGVVPLGVHGTYTLVVTASNGVLPPALQLFTIQV
jgi:large repetitive protein